LKILETPGGFKMTEKLIVVYGMSVDMQEILSSAKYDVINGRGKSIGDILKIMVSKCKGMTQEDIAIVMFEFGKWFERRTASK
jgi:hypothetical protein